MFESSILCTLFAYSLDDLDKYTELLASEMSKTLIGVKPAWALQDEAFRSNMPYGENKINKKHTFDRRSMSTVFPFFTSEVGHDKGIPLAFNRQTGLPYYLIILVQHLQIIIWLYLVSLVLVKVLLLKH